MLLSQISRITRNGSSRLTGCRLFLSPQPQRFLLSKISHPLGDSTLKVGMHQMVPLPQASNLMEPLDPFSLFADELSLMDNRLRSMVVAEAPKLASAAEYFFKMGVERKRFHFTVLLLMATALHMHKPECTPDGVGDTLTTELRTRQQCIAEIIEMIHMVILLHGGVLDDADPRHGIDSLNFVMDNKVFQLLATVLEHLVTGATMQMSTTTDQCCSMGYYMKKAYHNTASLISSSCKATALLAGQTEEVATLAFEYGKNVGLAYQLIDDVLHCTSSYASLGKDSLSNIHLGIVTAPILFAMEEFPQLLAVVDQGFDNTKNVDVALEYLGKSRGIQKTRELATKHASLAAAAIDSLPEANDEEVRKSRRALVDLTQIVITRSK